jgi:hypothetical protein
LSYENMNKSNSFNWSHKKGVSSSSSCRPAVLNTEFRLFPQHLQKNLGIIDRALSFHVHRLIWISIDWSTES